MRLSPAVTALAAALVVLAFPPSLRAQAAAAAPATSRPPGCRGTLANTSSVTLPGLDGKPVEFPGYAQIEDVQPGSPAERGGMRRDDWVLRQDGHDLVANPPTRTYLAGDTVHFVVWRDGAPVPLTLVLGRWDPPQEAPGVTRTCQPVAPDAGRD